MENKHKSIEREKLESAIEGIKYPRIKHIFNESGSTRDDLLVDKEERIKFLERFNSGLGVLTEKIDGLNIGIGFTITGELLLRHRNDLGGGRENPLYQNIYKWAEQRRELLNGLLRSEAVLFIEWMEWKHTIPYDNLPDFAQVIALFDSKQGETGKYMSHQYIKELFSNSGIVVVPEIPINKPIKTSDDCLAMIGRSHFSTKSKMEGLVLQVDRGNHCDAITKFVHPDFQSAVDASQHWTTKELERNKINYETQTSLLNT